MDLIKLKEEQNKLAKKVIISDSPEKIRTFGGTEQIITDNRIISVISVLDSDFKTIESKYTVSEIKMPYMSGFLFYREGPAIMETFSKLDSKPDILFVKGNGILHPRRIGMASHIGILLDIPTIGIAKSLMMGENDEGTIYFDKEAVGYELVSREHAKPLYVSPGHKVSLKTSLELARKSIIYPHKLPEPMHAAHKYASKLKKEKSVPVP